MTTNFIALIELYDATREIIFNAITSNSLQFLKLFWILLIIIMLFRHNCSLGNSSFAYFQMQYAYINNYSVFIFRVAVSVIFIPTLLYILAHKSLQKQTEKKKRSEKELCWHPFAKNSSNIQHIIKRKHIASINTVCEQHSLQVH